jgi:hypothetical protein
MKVRFAIPLLLVFICLPAFAQDSQMKLSDLMDICTGRDASSQSACRFYILGVTEGGSIGAGVAKDESHFCIRESVSSQNMVLIVKKAMSRDLAAFPKDKEMPAVSFVAAAMKPTLAANKRKCI